jgi:7tm Chemosensory receptor
MTSLSIAMCTFRKQWLFFELLDGIDDVLNRDFAVITPKKIYRLLAIFSLLLLMAGLIVLVAITYYVYSIVLNVPSMKICISYFLANLPYYAVIMIFYFSTSAIRRRFYYINNILQQLAAHDIPKNTFELCSRNSRNDRHMPTISLNEIYSIYGGYAKKNSSTSPPNKSYLKNRDEINREIKKLASKLEDREDSLISKIRRKDIIEIEEFKLSKMQSINETIEHLSKLLSLHDIMLDAINLQNEILSFQILLIVAQIFVFEVFSLFSLYRTMYITTDAAKAATKALAISNFFWFAIYNYILYVIMSSSTDCVNEGKYTGTCVHKVINKIATYADPRVVEKLSIMSHQLTMRIPDITCGLFSFDWELMFSIISATSIYLIFLMQFDVAGNANTPDTI